MPYLFNDKEREVFASLFKTPDHVIYNNVELKKQLQDLATKVTGQTFGISCRNCIADAKNIIQNNLKKDDMKPIERKSQYILKEGNFYFAPLAMHVSNSNLTDELAEKIMEINPKNEGYFVHAPKRVRTSDVKKDIIIIKAKQPDPIVVTKPKTEKEKRKEMMAILDGKNIKYARNYSTAKLTELLKANV